MGRLPRFLSAAVPGFEILDVKEWLAEGKVEIFLDRKEEDRPTCYRCRSELQSARGKHRMRVEGMPILGLKTYFLFWRLTDRCINRETFCRGIKEPWRSHQSMGQR